MRIAKITQRQKEKKWETNQDEAPIRMRIVARLVAFFAELDRFLKRAAFEAIMNWYLKSTWRTIDCFNELELEKAPDGWLTVLSHLGVDSQVDVEEEKEGNRPRAQQPQI